MSPSPVLDFFTHRNVCVINCERPQALHGEGPGFSLHSIWLEQGFSLLTFTTHFLSRPVATRNQGDRHGALS